ncbi:MAG: glycosyltransferase [Bacteroidota bacterium]
MKVLHVLSSCSGGAANAAITLHNGLIEAGVNSHIITLFKTDQKIKNLHFFLDTISLFQRLKYSIVYRVRNKRKNFTSYPFSNPFSIYDICKSQIFKDADIINLHWVSGFVDFESFLLDTQKPVVWTMHDEYCYLGGHHYEFYKQYESTLGKKIDTKYYKLKRKIFSKCRKIHFISPSRWLYEKASQSVLLSMHVHHHIPYGIDTNTFNADRIRNKKNLTVLVIASDLKDSRKGFADALEIIKKESFSQIKFLILGTSEISIQKANIHFIGYVHDKSQLASYYSESDLMLLTSHADNLPNTALESIANGTPILAYNIGGMPDIIDHQKNGFLVNSLEEMIEQLEVLAESIKELKEMRIEARKKSLIFSNKNQVEKYLDLYKSLQLSSTT